MDSVVLKDVVSCPVCNAKMYPSGFDRETRTIRYQCCMVNCKTEVEYGFDEVTLAKDEPWQFFCINDDGVVTWKCAEHGYCRFEVEDLFEMDCTKFESCCCVLGKDVDELANDLEYAETVGREKLSKLVAIIGKDRISEFADEILYDTPADLFDGDYVEALIGQAMVNGEDIDEFICSLIIRANEMYDIELDDNCDLV